jgi:hypothetical protein
MPTTDHGLTYPSSATTVDPRLDFQLLADSVETALDTYETYTSWTPVFVAGPTTIGAGGVSEGYYTRIGKWVRAEFRVELGTGFAVTGTTFDLTLPVAAYIFGGAAIYSTVGRWMARDDSVPRHYSGSLGVSLAAGTRCSFAGATSSNIARVLVTNTIPFTLAAGDIFSGALSYRAA